MTAAQLQQLLDQVRDGQVARGVWETSQLPPGDYVLRIIAADFSGNEAQEGRDVPIRVHQ